MSELFVIGIAAFIIGLSKTSVGGVGIVASVLFAAVMPAKESTAAVLFLLISGDLFACYAYRHDVDWRTIARLAPSVLVGIVAGAWYLGSSSDAGIRKAIGVVVLMMVALQLVLRSRPKPTHLPHSITAATGATAGFTSMVANAAGAPMAIYLMNMHISKQRYLGTTAWFFFALNVTKMPFSIQLGLLHADRVLQLLWFVPVVAAGAWVGRRLVHRISMDALQILILAAAFVGGLNLFLR